MTSRTRLRAELAALVLLGASAVLPGCQAPAPEVAAAPALPDPPGPAAPWLVDVAHGVGLQFVHEAGNTGHHYMPESVVGGCALFDHDNDGRLDVFLTGGNRLLPAMAAAESPGNRLFRQVEGGRFEDVTRASGLGDGSYQNGVAVGDIDNDGWLDLYLTSYGPDRLFRNRGDGTFEDVTARSGIREPGWSSSAAFCDYDRDGLLDLYVAVYVDYDARRTCRDETGKQDYCGPLDHPAVHDRLFHNEGGGRFRDVSEAAGIAGARAAALGVVCEDLDGDGWQDFYVANDAYANHLWINRRDGTFAEEGLIRGAGLNSSGEPRAGMGVFAADLDGDLELDLHVTNLSQETNAFFRSLGGGYFDDHSGASGMGPASMPYTGWSTVPLDVELDGDLDLAVVNGRVFRREASRPGLIEEYGEPRLFFLNDGTGRFQLAGEPFRAFLEPPDMGRGMAVGDIDNDGDLDLLVENTAGRAARLYRNDAPRAGHWLAVRALDPRYKREATGARLTLKCGSRRILRTVTRSFGYASSSDGRVHFGVGKQMGGCERIEVWWPDGLRESFAVEGLDRELTLRRGEGKAGT